jgi:hypothetical protein
LLTKSAIFFLSPSLDSVGGDEDLTVLSFAWSELIKKWLSIIYI